jgi:O-antigen ligase
MMSDMPLFVLAAPLLVVAVLAGLRSPLGVLLAIYAAILPFGSGLTVPLPIAPPFNTLTTLLGLLTIGAVIAHLALVPRRSQRIPLAVPVWLIFLGIAGLTFMWSISPSTTADDYAVLASLIVLYMVTSFMPVEHKDMRRIEGAVAAGGAITGVYAFFLTATNNLPLTGSGTPRFATAGGTGDAADPNITAAALLLPLTIGAGRAMRREERPIVRLAFAACSALSGGAIAMTGSRGGMIAGFIAVLIVAFHERRRSIMAMVAVGTVLVIGVAAATAPADLLGHVGKGSSSGRTDIWRIGLHGCVTYCWIGSGYATFPEVYRRVEGSTPAASAPRATYKAHNVALRVMVETGYLGLLVMLIGFGLILRDVMRLPRALRGMPLAGVAGVLIANLFLGNIDFKYFWLALMYGTLWTVAEATPERDTPAVMPRRQLATVG